MWQYLHTSPVFLCVHAESCPLVPRAVPRRLYLLLCSGGWHPLLLPLPLPLTCISPPAILAGRITPGRATVRLARGGVPHSKEKALCETPFAALVGRDGAVPVCGRRTLAVNGRIPPSGLEAVPPLSPHRGSLQTR